MRNSYKILVGQLIKKQHFRYLRVKVKVHPITCHEGPEGERRYSSTLSLTSALDGAGDQRHAPTAFPRERDPVSVIWEAGWAPEPVWTDAENFAFTGIRFLERPARSKSLDKHPYRPNVRVIIYYFAIPAHYLRVNERIILK
jgi:hypothetical protein